MKGLNKVHCKDWTTNELPDKSVQLIIADPPYFEVKGKFDFVWASFDDYLKDVEKWAIECKRVLADNGTLFWWGHAKKIAYSQIILDKYFNLENVIKWRKTDCQTRIGYETFRSFPPVTEHLLMYSQDEYNLTNCVFHIRDYIRTEIVKAKGVIVLKRVNEALGTATNGGGVASACLSLDKKEPTMITKDLYLKLQAWCSPYLRKEYEDLRKEYEDLRKEYEDLRRPFKNISKLTDVWSYAQDVHLTGKYNHDTKKTEKISEIIILSTSKESDLVLVPFAGSGTECAMAARTKRNFIGFDIEQEYVDMANKRCNYIFQTPTLF